jgi:hypothetical protein
MEILTPHEQVIILSFNCEDEDRFSLSLFFFTTPKYLSQEIEWNGGWKCQRNYHLTKI